MSVGWRTERLQDVCQIKPPKKEAKQRLSNIDLVSFVPMSDLGVCKKELTLRDERSLSEVSGSYTYFAENDVLLAKITPCFENGKLGIGRDLKNGIGFGSSEYIVFRSKGDVDPEYLFYFLSQASFRDAGTRVMSGAVGHKRVPKEFIENYRIPLPDLPEQKRIVAILDEAFEAITTAVTNAEKNLANARELFESYLNSVFSQKGEGWSEVRVEDVCDSIIDCVNKTAPKVENPTSYKMIRTTNVRDGVVSIDSVKYVTEVVYKVWTRRQVPKVGDVILTREAPLGEVGMLLSEDLVFLGQRLVSYRTNHKILNNYFLLYVFQSNSLQEQIQSLASGSTVQHMRVPDSKNLKLSIPNLGEQEKIIRRLDLLRNKKLQLETIYQQKLTALAELKQSILQKAFAGELTEDVSSVKVERVDAERPVRCSHAGAWER
ncbi:MAG: restriction endonuclease subunit S [Gammaproteobacteria bacterium]|nr:restriction endonuclease subunit S [Beggiatoa alba]PCH61586.1 MAG: restriction endonuclease subunit S [Gammaproteobacteria bacterium]